VGKTSSRGRAACLACAALAIGCKSRDVPVASTRPGAPAPSATVHARDHIVPGELVEGDQTAFGLKLPRGTVLTASFPQQILFQSPAKASDLANYVRARVEMGTVTVGAAATDFTRVQVPTNPGRELVIHVEPLASGTGSAITVRDVTPPPFNPNLTNEERWRQAGLKPGGGGPIDPTHLH
jgi:hypothetical protein